MAEITEEVSETTNHLVAYQEPTEPAEGEAGAEPAAEPEEAAPSADLGEGGKRAIDAEREARRQAEKQLREVKAALKSYEDRDKTELELLRERAETAEQRAIEAEQERLRQKVASEKGVPANRLAGTTEDELMAAADELIAWRDHSKPPAPPAKRPEPEALRSGASGVENTAADPKVAAAEKLRLLRRHG
jgi:hypothetical protein